MTVSHQRLKHGLWLVEVSGRLDQSQTAALDDTLDELLADEAPRLIVNLSDVAYVNSGGLRSLVSAWRRARQAQGDVILYGLNARLSDIFSMVGFDKVFDIVADLDSAQKALVQSPDP